MDKADFGRKKIWTRITRINTDKAKSMDNRDAYQMAISAWQTLSCCMTFNRFVPLRCCSLTLYPFLSVLIRSYPFLSAPIRVIRIQKSSSW
jgi:hypothetical protein